MTNTLTTGIKPLDSILGGGFLEGIKYNIYCSEDIRITPSNNVKVRPIPVQYLTMQPHMSIGIPARIRSMYQLDGEDLYVHVVVTLKRVFNDLHIAKYKDVVHDLDEPILIVVKNYFINNLRK